ncbi:MAG TPA: VOC family protein [Longimicrobiales bacterium]|nr:VOC family protein [Longimicrobiales bacterium]
MSVSSLGAFSVSLAVKDLMASKAFYEKLGFDSMGGNPDHGYLIMKNGHALIGLFQGMFEKNILTFNPGWDETAQNLDAFTDVRKVAEQLELDGLELAERPDPASEGPAHITLEDPDGNPVLIDQHR